MSTKDAYVKALIPVTSRVRTDITAIRTDKGVEWRRTEALTEPRLHKHLNGGPYRGCCPIQEGSSLTLLALLDFDSHKGESTWGEMAAAAMAVSEELAFRGLEAIPFRSTGGRGIHLLIIWEDAQDARSVRHLLADVLQVCGFSNGAGGVAKKQVEIFPKQNEVAEGKCGSQFILPLAGQSVPLDASMAPLPKESALAMAWPVSAAVPPVPVPEPRVVTSTTPANLVVLEEQLDAILEANHHSLGYELWRDMVFAIHYETEGSDEGLELAHAFSAKDSDYNPDALNDTLWPSAGSNPDHPITGKSIAFLAREAGWSPNVLDDFDSLPDTPGTQGLKAKETDGRHPFMPIQAAEFAMGGRTTAWLIKKVIPAAGVTMVFGASTSGKTFVVLDMAFAIALGQDWRGRKVNQGRVVYVAAEGAAGFRKRLHAYAEHYQINLEEVDLHVVSAAPSLLEREQMAKLADYVNSIGGCAHTVFDTVAQVTAGGNENSGEDMGKALKNCQDYNRAVGCSSSLIHHTGKDETRGARGWSGIRAAVDAELEVTRNDEARAMKVTKLKDGEEGADFGFKLAVIPLGFDEDGEVIDS